MSQVRHRRTSVATQAFPNPIEPGEIAVNTANRQIVVGDANGATLGVPVPLLAMRYFDVRAQYAAGDLVVNGGIVYRAKATVPPGAFNAANWDYVAGDINPIYLLKTGGTMTGELVLAADPTQPLDAATKQYADTKLALAGGTMTGAILLPNVAPSLGTEAAHKSYVDTKVASKSSVIVSDTPPAGAIDNTLWWESDSGLLFIRYNDGSGPSQWVLAVPVPDTSAFLSKAGDTMTGQLKLVTPPVAANDAAAKSYVDGAANGIVRYDTAQALTVPQQAQARGNLYGAPFDALAYSGMQINGSMDVCQETSVGTGVNVVGSSKVADVWTVARAGTSVIAAGIFVTGTNTYAFPGFTNALMVTVSTAQAVIGAADYALVQHPIESYRIARLAWGTANAQPITIGFWTAHHRAGLYTGTARNGANNRSYAFSYTQAVADVAQYNVVTIPGDTAGAWDLYNTVGLMLNFAMAMGSSFTAPSLNGWLAASYSAGPGQINGIAATSDTFRFGGVVVLPGIEAPSAARSSLIMRPYDQEFMMCQRYWCKLHHSALGSVNGVPAVSPFNFRVPMRVTPTAANISVGSVANASVATEAAIDPLGGYFQINCLGIPGYIIDRSTSYDARM